MKIIIISQYNIFSSIGGTEYYVDMLIKGLIEKKHEVVFITMGKQQNDTVIKYCIHKIFRYKCILLASTDFTNEEKEQRLVSSTWNKISPVLIQEKPDIIHVHTYTTFFNIRHFEKCKTLFKNIFFTTHIPAHFCPQGDLIKFNKAPCDGVIYSRCSVCLFTRSFKVGMSNLFHSYWKKVLQRVQIMSNLGVKLVCVSDWQKQQAMVNGFAGNQVYVIRQAIVAEDYTLDQPKKANPVFTIGYLGRLSPEKGAPLLLKLIGKMLDTTDYRFVLGIPLENCNPGYILSLRKLTEKAGDRIQVMENVTAVNKDLFFKEIDCLLISSFFIETGPIVLLEALMFNKQVVAPDIGGPVEFKSIFKDRITTYQWNYLPSVIQALDLVSKKKNAGIDNFTLLKEKEIQFITQHEKIYRDAILNEKEE